ncbi:putative calcium-binding protein CML36 [Hordeum vulgare]|uniref:Predicted protein n=1 Tax=Hordeum vulgare subsp. vulgare TaxID=112509 RepID=F2DBN6_HORVV|nr:probable calcium-binding protein CML36 [Hordeum vulgare subsp. vulgare]KAE8790517.1 putative calcium-binding protein CML36 [Hordeum vulgare]BAJ92507.1 predicted protein [Hordeum vulgare subsp. vulgare]
MKFFGSSTSKKENKGKKRSKRSGNSGSFASTASSSASDEQSVTTPSSVPPSSSGTAAPSGCGTTKKPAMVAVTRLELEVALRTVVSTEEELAVMLAEAEAGLALDGVEDGEAADEGELRDTFAVFDADGDGRISAEELRAVLATLGDERCSVEDCRRMIGGVDSDGDGFVCFDEFTRMMMLAL